MADHILWFQGSGAGRVTPCQEGPEFTCPESHRIAAEYARGYYTLTNVINTGIDPYNFSNPGWIAAKLDTVKAGDVIWLALVPPLHVVDDMAMHLHAGQDEGATIASYKGATLTLVGAKFQGVQEDAQGNPIVTDTCTMIGDPTELGSITVGDETELFTYSDQRTSMLFNQLGEWYGVGIRVDALPTDKTSLSQTRAILGAIVHARGFDMQQQMM